jgi:hypothetical protein
MERKHRSSSCDQLPHGLYSVIITIVAFLAWIAATVQDRCNFAHVHGPIVTLWNATSPWIAMGLVGWNEPTRMPDGTYQTSSGGGGGRGGQCQLYPPSFIESLDSMWSTGKTLAFLAQCIGGGGSLFVACSLWMVFSKATWKWTGYLLCFAGLCQAMSVLVWWGNDVCQWNTCSVWNGSGSNIVSSVLWILTGGFMVIKYPKNHRRRLQSLPQPADEEEEDTFAANENVPLPEHGNDSNNDENDTERQLQQLDCDDRHQVPPKKHRNDQSLLIESAQLA